MTIRIAKSGANGNACEDRYCPPSRDRNPAGVLRLRSVQQCSSNNAVAEHNQYEGSHKLTDNR
jgi:hypothetical protein